MKAAPLPDRQALAQDCLSFIDASPSPWHAAANVLERMLQAGFTKIDEAEAWALRPGGRYVMVRDDAALVAWIAGRKPVAAGYRIIGAHTDSPCLRVKPRGAHAADGYLRLATEIYGSPILATFSDRDLLLAGRMVVRGRSGASRSVLVRLDDGLVRLPNLPIHLNRAVNEDGLKLHKHSGLNLIAGTIEGGEPADRFAARLAAAARLKAGDLLAFELCAVDAQPGALFGLEGEFLASRQLDNLVSCHAAANALAALAQLKAGDATAMIALFDHEEVGSESRTGAAGNLLDEVLARIGGTPEERSRAMAYSWMLSADMAHAHHPAHPDCYDSLHSLRVNGGVALKLNAGQRYASSALGEGFLRELAQAAGVPLQTYIHRADLACGSTVGPICAARIGIRTIDAGVPMWAMHSCRESMGTQDLAAYQRLMAQFLAS